MIVAEPSSGKVAPSAVESSAGVEPAPDRSPTERIMHQACEKAVLKVVFRRNSDGGILGSAGAGTRRATRSTGTSRGRARSPTLGRHFEVGLENTDGGVRGLDSGGAYLD